MNADSFEQLLIMLSEVKRHDERFPGGSLRRVIPTVEHQIANKSALSLQTIAGRWTSDIGLEGGSRKAELRELLSDWLDGDPGPLYRQVLPHVPSMLKDKLKQFLFIESADNDDQNNASVIESHTEDELIGKLHLPPRELGAISIQAGKLGVSVWKFVELLVMREAQKALEKFEAVADVEDIAGDSAYPLQGAPFEYTAPAEPVGVDDWEALK